MSDNVIHVFSHMGKLTTNKRLRKEQNAAFIDRYSSLANTGTTDMVGLLEFTMSVSTEEQRDKFVESVETALDEFITDVIASNPDIDFT